MKKSLPYLVVCTLLVGTFYVASGRVHTEEATPWVAEIKVPVVPSPTPTPSASPMVQVSPDGKHNLELVDKGNQVLLVVDGKQVTSLDKTSSQHFSIPFNTWSPDDKAIFIAREDLGTTEYLVTGVNGEINGKSTLDSVNESFIAKYPESSITEVTGWAAPGMLVVNTLDASGNKVSYWYYTRSRGLVRLSGYFE